MRTKGRIQFLNDRGEWVDSVFSGDDDPLVSFTVAWLYRNIIRRPYRWLENGVAVYLPRSD